MKSVSNLFDTNTIDLNKHLTRIRGRYADGMCVDSQSVCTTAVESLINMMMSQILTLSTGAHVTGYIRDHDERVFLNSYKGLVSRVTLDTINGGASDARWEARAKGQSCELSHFARSVIHETLQVTHLRITSPATGDYGWRVTITRH